MHRSFRGSSEFRVEDDLRHAEIIVKGLGLKIKTVDTRESCDGMDACAGNRLLVSPLVVW